jgi:hypothetical protein
LAVSAITGALGFAIKNFDVGVLLSLFDRVAYLLLGTRYGYSSRTWNASGHRWKAIGIALVVLLLSSLIVVVLALFLPSFSLSLRTSLSIYIGTQVSVLGFLLWYQARWFLATLGGLQSWIGERAQRRQYDYAEYRVIYFVSEKRKDSWTRKISIRAKEDMVGIKTIDIGLSEDSFHAHRSPTSMKLRAETNPGKGRVLLFPFLQGLDWKISTLFTVPICPLEKRSLIVGGICKDTWRPLRESGSDQGVFSLAKDAELLEIVVVLPKQYTQANIVREEFRTTARHKFGSVTRKHDGKGIGEVLEEIDQHGRRQLIWRIDDAKPGSYLYKVTACAPNK